MDNLRQYINKHREDFEDQCPTGDLWSKIDERLGPPTPNKKHWSIGRTLLAAASVLFLFGLSFVAGNYVATQSTTISEISPEFAETEAYYNRKIEEKKRAVSVSTKDSIWVDDLQQLEVVMAELKQELLFNPAASKGDILKAMIDNYNIRLQIMDRILEKTTQEIFTNTKPYI